MIAQVQNKPETVEYDGKTPLKGKREKLCQEIAKGDVNNTEAARNAGYSNHKGLKKYAYLMCTMPEVKARIACIKAELAKKYDITRESQVKQYRDVIEVCDETGDMANKNKALNSIDKLFGLSVDKSVVEQTDAQEARTAAQRRLDKDYAQWLLMKDLEREKALDKPVMELTDV